MPRKSDVFPSGATVYFLPVQTRVPLKFGRETVTSVICARVRLRVANASGGSAEGWGETPLSVTWVWPSDLSHETRQAALQEFTLNLVRAWLDLEQSGHPIELGHAVLTEHLPRIWQYFNSGRPENEQMPWLAALVCCSAFDIALHDAYGNLNGVPVYETYNGAFMNHDLGTYLEAEPGMSFRGKYPADYLRFPSAARLPAWHLVGGKDLLHKSELTGTEPQDGYPVLLGDWIRRDGLQCLKIKLTGTDAAWDYDRIVEVGRIAIEHEVLWLTADFNCTVQSTSYVTDILDRLMLEQPRLYGMLLYVEQPFPYELEDHQIDVHAVSARKPLFMDESAHDWKMIRLGRSLGWTGVALKTCKTQTGALLSLSWARAHGMTLMVQDLTNPMLAQIPHLLLAAHAGTIMGVETNAMQFYPEASAPEAGVHPGAYQRRRGIVDLSSLQGSGFGYCIERIHRQLPAPAMEC